MRTKSFFISIVAVFLVYQASGQLISVTPQTTTHLCPKVSTDFEVTLTGIGLRPILSGDGNTSVLGIPVITEVNNNTIIEFSGTFNDVNVNQEFIIHYGVAEEIRITYTHIKSLLFSFSVPNPTPSTINAQRCIGQNFELSFDEIQFYNSFTQVSFGSISTYEYLLPEDWLLDGVASDGSSWLPGGNAVTITSDATHGYLGFVKVRALNDCDEQNLIKGQIVNIPIDRPRPLVTITGDDFICNGSKTYSTGPIPSGLGLCWSVSNTNYATVSSPPCSTSTSVTFVSPGVIDLRLEIEDCIESWTISKSVLIGAAVGGYYKVISDWTQPGLQLTLYNNNNPVWLPANEPFEIDVYINSPGLTSLDWNINPNSFPFQSQFLNSVLQFWGTSAPLAYQTRRGIFDLKAETVCGDVNGTYSWPIISTGGRFTLKTSPNPAKDILTISIESTTDHSTDLDEMEFELKIFELATGTLVLTRSQLMQENLQIDVSNLQTGLYRVMINSGGDQAYETIYIE